MDIGTPLDPRTVLRAYLSLDKSKTGGESLTRVVERYMLPWLNGSIGHGSTHSDISFFDRSKTVEVAAPGLESTSQTPVLCYNGVLSGDETNSDLQRVRRMAGEPLFYRLNFIRQLSTTHLSTNLDAAHNRLSHSLGTLDVASRFVAVLKNRMKPVEQKAVLVYAFIHDCFHGPLGHTLDIVRDVLWGPEIQDERIDKHLLLVNIEMGLSLRKGPLWAAVLRHVAANEEECRNIFQYLEGFLVPQKSYWESVLGKDVPRKNYLAEIVDSELDSDRIDYIWRDHVHLEMANLDIGRKVERLIASVTVISENGDDHLCYSFSHRETIEQLLDVRLRFYSDYYEHPTKIVADEMLAHVIYHLLRAEDVLKNERILAQFANALAYLTDDGLFGFLTEATGKPEHDIPYILFEDFRANRPFEIVYQKGLHKDNLAVISTRANILNLELKRLRQNDEEWIREFVLRRPLGLFDRGKWNSVISKFNEKVREDIQVPEDYSLRPGWRGSVLEYTPEEDVYRIQTLYGDGFLKKILLEDLLWEELHKDKAESGIDLESALIPLAECIAARGFRTSAEARDLLRKTPLVFISLSWIPGISEDDLVFHQRGYRRNSIRFHRAGIRDDSQPEPSVKPRDEDYHLIVSAPTALLKAAGMKQFIRKTFERILGERKWAIPSNIGAEWEI